LQPKSGSRNHFRIVGDLFKARPLFEFDDERLNPLLLFSEEDRVTALAIERQAVFNEDGVAAETGLNQNLYKRR